MNDMIARYNKDVMICEVGMSWTDSAACKSFIADLFQKQNLLQQRKWLRCVLLGTGSI